MRKLEARFYPPLARSRFVVVAHNFIPTDGADLTPRIRPTRTVSRAGSPAPILSTLRYLVHTAMPASWERLTGLRSRYWSFTPVQLSPEDLAGEISVARNA